MNKALLVGRLTRDPELRYTGNNTPVASFSIAVNRTYTNKNGERDADFINIVVWQRQAESVNKYLSKGSLVSVEGRIQSRSYDAKDGSKRYVTEVNADNVQFLESKEKTQARGQQNNDYNYESNKPEPKTTNVSEDPFESFGSNIEISDDDLPF
jgi:single-strand DNA-binding protein